MRLIFAAAIASATVTGLLGAYSVLPSKTTDEDFAAHYLRLARNAPDDQARCNFWDLRAKTSPVGRSA